MHLLLFNLFEGLISFCVCPSFSFFWPSLAHILSIYHFSLTQLCHLLIKENIKDREMTRGVETDDLIGRLAILPVQLLVYWISTSSVYILINYCQCLVSINIKLSVTIISSRSLLHPICFFQPESHMSCSN